MRTGAYIRFEGKFDHMFNEDALRELKSIQDWERALSI
jgi:hypothetical protein